ncbi:MAG: hypothetical protein ABIU95_02705 [Burkholderiales bacterium]
MRRSSQAGLFRFARAPCIPSIDARWIGLVQDERQVTLELADGAVSADVLIGADGVHSQVRSTLFGGDNPMNFVGIVERDDWRFESRTVRGTATSASTTFAGGMTTCSR